MENANGPVPPQPNPSPNPVVPPVSSYNQQNPMGHSRPRLPIDFIIVMGLVLLSAVYTFFAGAEEGLNTGNSFIYFLTSFATVVLVICVFCRMPVARKILIGLAVFNILFYVGIILSMVQLQRDLSELSYRYDQEIAKLEQERGLTAANSPQIKQFNDQVEASRAANSKMVGTFYVANSINIVINGLLVGYLVSPRVRRVFTP